MLITIIITGFLLIYCSFIIIFSLYTSHAILLGKFKIYQLVHIFNTTLHY